MMVRSSDGEPEFKVYSENGSIALRMLYVHHLSIMALIHKPLAQGNRNTIVVLLHSIL